MTQDLIERFIETKKRQEKTLRIHFKGRNAIKGIFVFTGDYTEMKKKNFWRIVPETRFDEWAATGDLSLSRLFNGAAFTRLSDN